MNAARRVPITTLVALLAACGGPDAEDLGDLSSGKADFTGLSAPVFVSANTTEHYLLTADGPFEVVITQTANPPTIVVVGASGSGRTWVGSPGSAPMLRVDLTPGTSTQVDISVSNTGATDLRGRIDARPAAPADDCADAPYLAWMDSLESRLEAANSTIDPAEAAALDALVATRPCVSRSDDAYAPWLAWFSARLTAANTTIDPQEQLGLDYVVGARPAATGGASYALWFQVWKPAFAGANSTIDSDERKRLALVAAARPLATDDASYATWALEFAPLAASTNSALDADERDRLDLFVSVKPCALATPAAQASAGTLTRGLSGPVLTEYAARVQPAACP